MPTFTGQQNLPDNAKPIAERIEALGLKWKFDYQYPVPPPDKVQKLQVRNVDHAPPSEVSKYAAAMKRNDKFPPGVVTEDARIVDFNTRAAAAHKVGIPTFPVFVLSINYATASEFDRERVQLLAAGLNYRHGKGLNRFELAENVRKVAKNPDWTPEKVAGHLGASASTVSSIFSQFKAERRAERLGVPFNDNVTDSNKAMLGQRKFTDAPFKGIAELARDAGLTNYELRDLCNRVQAAGTEDEQVGVVQAERASREAQITHLKVTGRKKPPLSSELRKRLGFILGHETTDVTDLLDLNPESRADYLGQLDRAIFVLQEVARRQRSAIAAQAA